MLRAAWLRVQVRFRTMSEPWGVRLGCRWDFGVNGWPSRKFAYFPRQYGDEFSVMMVVEIISYLPGPS